MKIVSWNVNGIAACRRKGFLEFLADAKPDIVCCQEIKTRCSLNTPGYTQFWNLSKKNKMFWNIDVGAKATFVLLPENRDRQI